MDRTVDRKSGAIDVGGAINDLSAIDIDLHQT
jgi:hypothetical protein